MWGLRQSESALRWNNCRYSTSSRRFFFSSSYSWQQCDCPTGSTSVLWFYLKWMHFISVIAKQHTTVISKSRILLFRPFFDRLLLPQFSSYRHQTNWKTSGLNPLEVLVAKLFDIPINFCDIQGFPGKKVPFKWMPESSDCRVQLLKF